MRAQTKTLPKFVLSSLTVLLAGAAGAQLSPIGLSEVRGQWFMNDDPTSSAPDAQDLFAAALAVGDFNGDGADDLATGVPADDSLDGSVAAVGSVAVRYGAPGGGLAGGPVSTVLRQLPEEELASDYFGAALAAGDFNGDGIDDLAVGIPADYENDFGAVRVFYGAPGGLQTDNYEYFDESYAGEDEHICAYARFGSSLAAGNFDNDPYDDLAIGAYLGCELVGDDLVAGGSVFVAHGQEWGLLPWFGYRISQNSVGMANAVDFLDFFGFALAAGDFNGDTYDDLAVGVPRESGAEGAVGAVQTVMGSSWGLLFANNVFWLPGALGEVPEDSDYLGRALTSADFDGDGFDDLAIGSSLEDLGSGQAYEDTGSIAIAYGAADPAWFDLSRTERLSQSVIYGSEAHEASFDYFGNAFAAADFDADGFADLAIGHLGDDWAGIDHGAVTVLMGAQSGIGSSGRFRLLAVGWEGLPGNQGQTGQFSGQALAAGDFDGDGHGDLAIGVPSYDMGGQPNIGGEAVLYGSLFADGFEIGDAGRWPSVLP